MRKILLFPLVLLFLSCEKEEINTIQDGNDSIQIGHSLEFLEFSELPKNILVNFNSRRLIKTSDGNEESPFGKIRNDIPVIKFTSKSGIKNYTFALSHKKEVDNLENTSGVPYFDNLTIKELENGKTEVYVIRYEPEDKWYQSKRDFNFYSGRMTFYTPSGVKINSIELIEGKIEDKSSLSGVYKVVCHFKVHSITELCTEIVDADGGWGERCVTVYHYKSECTTSGGGDGDDDGGVDHEEIPLDGVWSAPILPEPDLVVQINRDPSFIKINKINCTYEQLEKTASLNQILVDFFGEDAIFDLTFTVAEDLVCNENTNAAGCASQIDDYNYKVSLDKEYILDDKTPTIFLAETMIHESMHANLYAAVVKLNDGILPSDTSFAALYEDYRNLKDWQHDAMAKHYTGIIQKALEEVHPHLNDSLFLNAYDDNSLWVWKEFYEYLSYRGLQETLEGSKYYSENTLKINLYEVDAKTFSTKDPNCNE